MCGSYLTQKRPEATVLPWVICDRWWITNKLAKQRSRALGKHLEFLPGKMQELCHRLYFSNIYLSVNLTQIQKAPGWENTLSKCGHRCSVCCFWLLIIVTFLSKTCNRVWDMGRVEKRDKLTVHVFCQSDQPSGQQQRPCWESPLSCHHLRMTLSIYSTLLRCFNVPFWKAR